MRIFRSNDHITTSWSGGSTTELCIYPFESSYAERNFLFRLSTATVETESSDFTPLAGFNRVLMVLNGSMELVHEQHHSILLNQFDTDTFEGAWQTKSKGKCRDFNLIMKSGISGKLEVTKLAKGQTLSLNPDPNQLIGAYIYKGSLLTENEEEDTLKTGDFILFDTSLHSFPTALENCTIIVATIQLP